MYITVTNLKGGVGKTTTAIHLAAFLSASTPTLVLDADPNRSATRWARHGKLPFTVLPAEEGIRKAREFEHVIIDTQGRPQGDDLASLAKGCDLLVLPTSPSGVDIDALIQTLDALDRLPQARYRVLATIVPPLPETDGRELTETLVKNKVPMFTASIPRLKAFKTAFDLGVPVDKVDDRRAARAWEAYAQVGEEVLA